MSGTHHYSESPETTPTLLLVWDAPNIDMGLGAILGSRPTAAHRPRFDAVGRWLVERTMDLADDVGTHIEPEALHECEIAGVVGLASDGCCNAATRKGIEI